MTSSHSKTSHGVVLPSGLPIPTAEEWGHCARVAEAIAAEIRRAGGWISFERYMDLALHAPGLGYYAIGTEKLGEAGDFITAPELTPLFGRTLAQPVSQTLRMVGGEAILEFGAGSGALARDLLLELRRLGATPQEYWIVEVSPDLRQRQQDCIQQSLPELADRVRWLVGLPLRFRGAVIANEVLDAMPVQLASLQGTAVLERGVVVGSDGAFAWQDRPAADDLREAMAELTPPAPYVTERNRIAEAWVADLGHRLEAGALFLIDYGFPAPEYFHPQRSEGTLMCHFRHHAHGNPLILSGIQDITAHVDFSAIAKSARTAGLELLGYCSQGQFLLNAGLTEVLERIGPTDSAAYVRAARDAARLISPAEMGELFKVLAVGRGLREPLLAFRTGDRSHTL